MSEQEKVRQALMALDELEFTLRKHRDNFSSLVEHARSQTLQADSDFRKGIVVLNGASLVALVTLFDTKMPPATLAQAGWLFFSGLLLSLLGWLGGVVPQAQAFHGFPEIDDALAKVARIRQFGDLSGINNLSNEVIAAVSRVAERVKPAGKAKSVSLFCGGVALIASLFGAVRLLLAVR